MTDETLFEKAISIVSPQERIRFVEKALGENREKCERFLELLAAHDTQDDLLDSDSPLDETQTILPSVSDQIGKQIGPYKLLQQIGHGGFGVVYLAEESKSINRRVALKIIKPGMGTDIAASLIQSTKQAVDVLDAGSPAKSFRIAIRQLVQKASEQGINTDKQVESLVSQICYRVSDLSCLLDVEGESLTTYCQALREEPNDADTDSMDP